MIELKAPAKINLYLRVVGRRADGYHLLETLMQKVALYDRLEIERIVGPSVVECPDSDLPVDEKNLALRAALLFFSSFRDRLPQEAGVRIVLRKEIPVAAGLGGGSSDAAAVLRGLDRLFESHCSKEELADLGLQLGADVPFFVYDWPVAWATGIGERLVPACGVRGGSVLLVNPGFPVATRWVFENLPLTFERKKISLSSSRVDVAASLGVDDFLKPGFEHRDVHNDLEAVTERAHPEIALIKSQLASAGADSVLMSGSGPTVFALFAGGAYDKALACARIMSRRYKHSYLVSPLENESGGGIAGYE